MKKVIQAKSIYPNHDENNVIYIENGHIQKITDKLLLDENTAKHAFIDLSNYHLYPSFNDSHMHLIGYGASLNQCLLDGVKSIKQLQDTLSDFLSGHQTEIVIGRGWNQDLFEPRQLPSRYDLDLVCSNKPVILYRTCGHIAVVNSCAIEYFKIDAHTVVAGGAIDLTGGEPTGIIRENALSIVRQDPSFDAMTQFILDAQKKLHRYGITSVQTDDLIMVDASKQHQVFDLFRSLETRGLLKLRVYQQSQFFTPEDLRRHLSNGYRQNTGGQFFKLGPLKILADGSLGSRTAKLRKYYHDAPGLNGILIHTESELKELISIAKDHDLDVAIHGIGDFTINWIIENLSKIVPADKVIKRRDAIIHCQIMDFDMIKAMGKAGIHALVQPVFLEYDMNIVENRVGRELARYSYAYHTMLENNIKLAFGSDAPVEDPNPFRGLYYAMYRKNLNGEIFHLNECLDFHTAFDAYTKNGAFFSYESDFKGELKSGFLADFIAVPDLLETLEPDELLRVSVSKTFVAGECVYSE
ncbi:amidohydrolase [Fusibacter bizertensis]